MERCPICNLPLGANEETTVFFSESTGKEINACRKCEKILNRIFDSNDPAEVRSAINRIYSFAEQTDNNDVHDYLIEVIENNSSVVNELVSTQKNTKPIPQRDYYKEKEQLSLHSDGWISGVKFISWIAFITIIIVGIIIAIPMFRYGNEGLGFAIVLLAFVAAFLTVGLIMVFLNMALDIKAISYKHDQQK